MWRPDDDHRLFLCSLTGRLAPAKRAVLKVRFRRRAKVDASDRVQDSTEVDLRFAVNTITTNGFRRHRRVTVVRMSTPASSTVGIASRSGNVDVHTLLAAAEADAQNGSAAEDAGRPCRRRHLRRLRGRSGSTQPAVLRPVLSGLGEHWTVPGRQET